MLPHDGSPDTMRPRLDPAPTGNEPGQPAACPPRRRTDLVTLVFTDIVGSTALKQRLGERAGTELLHRHHRLVREILVRFPEASEIGVAGDSFFIVLAKPSESVRFALDFQAALRRFNQGAPPSGWSRIGSASIWAKC